MEPVEVTLQRIDGFMQSAADQLIDSLSREDGVKRLSVRIVLRTTGQDEVEAGAEWESQA